MAIGARATSKAQDCSNSSRNLSPSAMNPHPLMVCSASGVIGRRHCVRLLYEERPSTQRDPSMPELQCSVFSPREEERLLKGALGCAIPEFIARFGAAHAAKQIESELRRARRARSRKLYTFWSAVRAQIEKPSKGSSTRQRAEERGPLDPAETSRFRDGAQQWRQPLSRPCIERRRATRAGEIL